MAELPQKVLSWLHNVLLSQEYYDVNRTFSDVAQTLSKHLTLRPQTDVYTFENGHSALLLHLRGTIPVPFRGTIYSYPISIWVPQSYPRESPIAFVTPTRDIAVRPGQHVSGEGRIYHPYLASWRPDRSNLDEFTGVLQDAFSREPPVISRRTTLSSPTGEPPPLPPLPPELGGGPPNGPSTSSPQSLGRPPPPPPKPYQGQIEQRLPDGSTAPQSVPHPNVLLEQRRASSQSLMNSSVSTSQTHMSNQTYAPQRQSSLRHEHYSPAQLGQMRPTQAYDHWQSLSGPQEALPHNISISQRDPGAQQRYYQQHPPPLPGTVQSRAGAYGLQSPPQQPIYQPTHQQQRQSYPPPNQPPPPRKPPEDLLTSSSDAPLPAQPPPSSLPAPPIPPNPEKDALLSALSRTLTQHLHDSLTQNASRLTPLQAQHTALANTLSSLQNEQQALTSLSALLSSNESILHTAMRDADKVIAEAKHRTVPGVDEVLVAPTVVAEQMYELVAEERACVEARGVLSRALDKGRVGVEVWVRSTRGVAREEFLKKALIRKAARGMGLREEEEWVGGWK